MENGYLAVAGFSLPEPRNHRALVPSYIRLARFALSIRRAVRPRAAGIRLKPTFCCPALAHTVPGVGHVRRAGLPFPMARMYKRTTRPESASSLLAEMGALTRPACATPPES